MYRKDGFCARGKLGWVLLVQELFLSRLLLLHFYVVMSFPWIMTQASFMVRLDQGRSVPGPVVFVSPRNMKFAGGLVLTISLQWRHNGRDGVSNHQHHDCLLNHLFRRTSKKTSKLRVNGLCAWNSPVTGEFHAQRASNAENVSIDDVIMISDTKLPELCAVLLSYVCEAEWRIWAPDNRMMVSSGNGLTPVRRQVITWIDADLLSTGPFQWNFE